MARLRHAADVPNSAAAPTATHAIFGAHRNGNRKRYHGIVPAKRSNEGRGGPKEIAEGRPLTKENAEEPNPCRTQSRESGPSGLDPVRQAARRDEQLRFAALLHHFHIELLRRT